MDLFDGVNGYPYHIAELILARIAGIATPMQQQELDSWIAESECNRELYRRISEGKRFTRYGRESLLYDYHKRLAELKAHIKYKRNRVLRRSIAAAVMIMPLLALVFILHVRLFFNPQEAPITVEPGSTHALLTLADGSVIDLSSSTKPVSIPGTNIGFEGDTLVYSDALGITEPQPQHITIPRGGEYFLRLSDGTGVWLNSESRLSYPTLFGNGERKVFLRGEAYFEVFPDKERAFIVESENHRVVVTGTSFAIRAYDDEEAVFTTLESGRVYIESDGDSVDLMPGFQSVAQAGRIEVRNIDTSLYTAWYTGKFVFVDRPLAEILATLARWYDIEVHYTEAGIENICFTGELKRYAHIDQLLSKFETLEKVRFTITDRLVTVLPY